TRKLDLSFAPDFQYSPGGWRRPQQFVPMRKRSEGAPYLCQPQFSGQILAAAKRGRLEAQSVELRRVVVGEVLAHLRGQRLHLPLDRSARVWPGAVGMRIVGCPHHVSIT